MRKQACNVKADFHSIMTKKNGSFLRYGFAKVFLQNELHKPDQGSGFAQLSILTLSQTIYLYLLSYTIHLLPLVSTPGQGSRIGNAMAVRTMQLLKS